MRRQKQKGAILPRHTTTDLSKYDSDRDSQSCYNFKVALLAVLTSLLFFQTWFYYYSPRSHDPPRASLDSDHESGINSNRLDDFGGGADEYRAPTLKSGISKMPPPPPPPPPPAPPSRNKSPLVPPPVPPSFPLREADPPPAEPVAPPPPVPGTSTTGTTTTTSAIDNFSARTHYKKTAKVKLLVGGSDGSGTRSVVELLQKLGVHMVIDDMGTYDVHGQEMLSGKGWPEVVRPILQSTFSADYDYDKLSVEKKSFLESEIGKMNAAHERKARAGVRPFLFFAFFSNLYGYQYG